MRKMIWLCILIPLAASLQALEIGNNPRFSIRYETAFVNRAVFLRDSQTIAVGTTKDVQLWDTRSGQKIKTLGSHANKVMNIVLSKTGRYLATYAYGAEVKVWDLKAGSERTALKPADYTHSIAISPDDQFLVHAGETVHVRNLGNGTEAFQFKPGTGLVTDMQFDNTGRYLVLGLSNGNKGIEIYDFTTRKLVRRIETGMDVTCLVLSPDNQLLAAGLMYPEQRGQQFSGSITMVSFPTGQKLYELGKTKGHVTGLAFHPQENILASTQYSSSPSFYLWDLKQKKASYEKKDVRRNTEAVGFSPDGKSLFVVNTSFGNLGNPSKLDVYDTGTKADLSQTGGSNDLSTFKKGQRVRALINTQWYTGVVDKTGNGHYLLKMDNRQPEYWKWVRPGDLRPIK
ncbi:MAG: hypothetical protein KDK39_14605 [Leptospiraceae bacterium]|nr:hypothetical protein [Leptospiraceae bacterium]